MDESEPEMVWAWTAPNRVTRMTKAKAEANGFEIDTRPPVGLEGGFRVYAVTPHLPIEEQKRLREQTGRDIRDYDDLKRYYRETGNRSLERGEAQDLCRRRLAEGGDVPDATTGALLGKKNSVDIHKIYEEIRKR